MRRTPTFELTGEVRASQNALTGNIGETEVTAKFEKFGWGVAPNTRHDVGTDLIVMVRDKRLFDLGLVLGVQVKTGRSWFGSEERDESGALVGWWYADADRRHVDAWLAHALPHLIVLHDLDTKQSYWVHVVWDAVVSTGKGARLLVRAENTLDEAHRDALLRVASSKRTGGAWEGSAWTGAAEVPPVALLRHALLVPRLIAPHPNLGHDKPVTVAQAIALLVQARVGDLEEHAERHDAVPTMLDAQTSGDWDWRFVAAIWRRVAEGSPDALIDLAQEAPDPARRVVASLAAAATLLEDGRVEGALALLDAALEPDDADPVDHAWLVVQKARACADIGRVTEARDLAAEAQALGATHAEDVTAVAIAGAAAVLLFETSDWDQRELATVIAGSDTTASWWRTQTVSHGLVAVVQRTFWGWARDTTTRWSVSDTANDQLVSAALTASFTGDHSTWRHLTGLLGQDGLLRLERDADPDRARAALDALRLSGDVDDLKLAVRRLADDGPSVAVSLASSQVDLARSTRTTASADLTLLEFGGDLLDTATADRTVRWLLATLEDPRAFVGRTSPTFLVDQRLLDTLGRVVPAASAEVQQLVAASIADLDPQPDQGLATSWARVVQALPESLWTSETAEHVAARAIDHQRALQVSLLGAAASAVPTARKTLLDQAATGALDALAALGDVTLLPQEIVRALITSVASRVHAIVEEAQTGRFGFGPHDEGAVLALLNAWHQDLADWPSLIGLITDDKVMGRQKAGALRILANLADRVPDPLRGSLRVAAAQVPTSQLSLMGPGPDARGPATELIAALRTDDVSTDVDGLLGLLAGDASQRTSAAQLVARRSRPEDFGVLLSLINDLDPGVRASAAGGLARALVNHGDGPLVVAGLRRAAADPGRRVARAVASALSSADSSAHVVAEVQQLLRSHPSAAVRLAVQVANADRDLG